MSSEGLLYDRKSLRSVLGKTADWSELAKDCVSFANAAGGTIEIGVEDDEIEPPTTQIVDDGLMDKVRRRVGEMTVNVDALPERRSAGGGGQSILLRIARGKGVASTSDGRYYIRVGDECCPITGDDVLRLADERPSTPWEVMTTLGVPSTAADPAEVAALIVRLRTSERVKASVKEKDDGELLAHYDLARGSTLTNLGILMVGGRQERTRLGTAVVIQAIRYDEQGTKTTKLLWDDYSLGPAALIDEVWSRVPDFREQYELPDGMFRVQVAAYDESVVRELLVNALVHRPYTHRGDVFLNLRPDHLEVVNPGRLPLGVTPDNILHESRRRNDGLARVFHDLGLMEKEGSGFDRIYEQLLATGRQVPLVREGADSVHVTIPRRVVHPGVLRLISEADQRYQLGQRERITLGLLAQTEGLTAVELSSRLALHQEDQLRPWLGRLLDLDLVAAMGRTKGRRYYVRPDLLREVGLARRTTLARVQPHRLRELIFEDVRRYPDSQRGEIHGRVGPEVNVKAVARALRALVDAGDLVSSGARRTKYRLAPAKGQA